MTKTCTQCLEAKILSAFKFRRDRQKYETVCRVCRGAARLVKYHSDDVFRADNKRRATEWSQRNVPRTKIINAKSRYKRKMLALSGYGGQCRCCGERRITMLDIDHVHNDGYQHRKEIGRKSMYDVVIQANFPDRFQLLCCNCNHSKRRNKGVCEHQTEGPASVATFDFTIANAIGVA